MILAVLAVGIIATVLLDLYLVAIQPRLLHVPFTGFDSVGRWVLYFREGRFTHDSIAKTAPLAGEKAVGWIVHYGVGIVFTAVLIVLWDGWVTAPTLVPAMIVGIGSLLAPFCIMQPAMGSGFAASKTPNPWAARLRSFMGHAVFGIGLYVGGLVVATLLL